MPWTLKIHLTGAGESPDCTIAGCAKLARHHVTALQYDGELVVDSKYGRLCDQHLAEARAKCGVPAGPVVAPPAEPEPAAAAPEAPKPKPPRTWPIPAGAKPTTCSSCPTAVYWILTENMKRMPIDAFGPTAGQSHFSTCPNADQHRKPREKRSAS